MTEPEPNPLWTYTPPATSKDGKTFRMDAMDWAAAVQHNQPRTANPYRHRGGRDGELLYDRWHDGWDDENARRTKA